MRIFRCPELKRLPKSSRYTSIHWRNQTPGSLEPFYSGAGSANQVLDPSHPLAGVRKPKLPHIRNDDLGIKVMPMGLLLKEPRLFAPIPPLTWDERVQKAAEAGITGVRNAHRPNYLAAGFREGEQLYPEEDYNMLIIPERRAPPRGKFLQIALHKVSRRVPMSCHISVSKKRMGAERYMRREVEKRLRASLNYIVARGAYYDADAKQIKFNPEDAGRKWALQGWAYLFFPSVELYNKPYGELITFIRSLLQNINKQAIAIENEWLNRSLLEIKPTPSRIPSQSEESRTKPLNISEISAKTPSVIPTTQVKPRTTSALSTPHLVPGKNKQTKTRQPHTRTTLQTLAGKTPKVWRSELIAGMKLISEQLSSSTGTSSSKVSASRLSKTRKGDSAGHSGSLTL